MSTTQVLGDASFSPPGQHPDSLTARIDALPSSPGLWSFITLLALGGFFELYDLFQTGYISTGLLAEGIFHTGKDGVFGIADQAPSLPRPLWGCLSAPVCSRRWRTDLDAA